MQQRIHMQDQVINCIAMLMNDQNEKIKQAADDIVTFVLIVAVLALGVVW